MTITATTNNQAIIKFYTDFMKSEANRGAFIFIIPDEMRDFVADTLSDWKKNFEDGPLYLYRDHTKLVLVQKQPLGKVELDSNFYYDNVRKESVPLSESDAEAEVKIRKLEETNFHVFYGIKFLFTKEFLSLQKEFIDFYFKGYFTEKERQLDNFAVEFSKLIAQFVNTPYNVNIFRLKTKEIFYVITLTELKIYPKTFKDKAKEIIRNW